MPYLPQTELEKQKELQQGDNGTKAPVLSGPSGVSTTAVPSEATKVEGPTRSGAYTNLNSYLDANAGQGGQLATKLSDTVTSDADAGKAQLQSAQDDFTSRVQSSGVSKNNGLISEAFQNPTGVLQDEGKRNQLTQIRDAAYTGPSGLADVDGYQSAKDKLGATGRSIENLQSESGRISALASTFARPTYSSGQQKLDQMLLQNTPEANDVFANLKNKYANLNSVLGDAETSAAAMAAARKAETEQAKSDLYSAAGRFDDPSTSVNEASGYYGNLQSALSSKAAQANAARDAAVQSNQALKASLAQRAIDKANADKYGLADGTNLYGLDPSAYFSTSDGLPATYQNVASKDDYAKYQAINELLGVSNPYLSAEAAGTYSDPSNTFDSGRFASDVAAARAKYEAAYNAKGALGMNWSDGNARSIADIVNDPRLNTATGLMQQVNAWIEANGGNSKLKVNS